MDYMRRSVSFDLGGLHVGRALHQLSAVFAPGLTPPPSTAAGVRSFMDAYGGAAPFLFLNTFLEAHEGEAR